MSSAVWRALAALGAWAVVTTIMLIAGMGPRPLFLALAIGVVAVGGGLVADLAFAAEPAKWRIEPESESAVRGRDILVERLKQQVIRLHDPDTPNETLAPMLVSLIEDEIRGTRGIDRLGDPDAFAVAVGPHLAEFVDATSKGVRTMTRQSLTDVVNRIESL